MWKKCAKKEIQIANSRENQKRLRDNGTKGTQTEDERANIRVKGTEK